MGIYKRKQESKKTRKHAFHQESDPEKKRKNKENTLSTKKAIKKNDNGQEKKKENTLSTKKATKKKKEKMLFFFSYFLVFFDKFSPQGWEGRGRKVLKLFVKTRHFILCLHTLLPN